MFQLDTLCKVFLKCFILNHAFRNSKYFQYINSTINNSPINSTINSTTVVELADATSLYVPISMIDVGT